MTNPKLYYRLQLDNAFVGEGDFPLHNELFDSLGDFKRAVYQDQIGLLQHCGPGQLAFLDKNQTILQDNVDTIDKLKTITSKENRITVVGPVTQPIIALPTRNSATISYDAIKHKLELGGIDNVNRKVIKKMIARQATLVMTAMGFDDPGAIVGVYKRTEAVFGTSTKMDIVCEAKDRKNEVMYVLDGTLDIEQDTNSIFYKAYHGLNSFIVKVPHHIDIAQREANLYAKTVNQPGFNCLVPVELVTFHLKSSGHELNGRNAGIVMPFYLTTLMQIPRGVSQLNLSYERVARIEEGLKTIHNIGYCHCDVKPSNVFLTVDHQMFLGDYDAVCLTNSLVIRTTPMFLPAEFSVLQAQNKLYASPVVDFGMLVCTLIWISFREKFPNSPTLETINLALAELQKENQADYRSTVISNYISLASHDVQHAEGAAILFERKQISKPQQNTVYSSQESCSITPLI